jgi:tetratricopeptide (TPR) repeat protein
MARADALAYAVIVQELPQADRLDYFTETLQVRLFRRHPALRFIGRAHPRFLPPVEELAARVGKRLLSSAITVRRHAYLSVPTESKLRWAARLLALELQDRPGQFPVLIEYGKTLLRLNDPEGNQVLARAVEQLLPFRYNPSPPWPEVPLLLEYLLTVAPQQNRSSLSRADAWDMAQRWFPASPPLLWVGAAQLFQERNYAQAAQLLTQLLALGQTRTYDRSHSFSPTLVGEDALMNLGACFTRLGEWDRAERCFQQLLQSDTHRARAQQSLAELDNLRRQAGKS